MSNTKTEINYISSVLKSPYVIVTFAISVCLYMWFCMPLYPDEVATRMSAARFFTDNEVQYGLYPVCTSNFKFTNLIFYPAAAFYSYFNSIPNWLGARLIPSTSILISTIVVLYISKKNNFGWSSGVFLVGFIGVSGSGLVLSRPEWVLLLHGISCLLMYYLLFQIKCREFIANLAVIGLSFVTLLSLYLHLQGVIFLPVTLILLISYCLRRDISQLSKALSVIAIGVVFIGFFASVEQFSFVCSEIPSIKHFTTNMTITGVYSDKGLVQSLWFFVGKVSRYIGQFQFGNIYDINYLPSVFSKSVGVQAIQKVTNLLIVFLISLNLMCCCVVAFYSCGSILKDALKAWQSKTLSDSNIHLILVFLTAIALLGLFIYDAATNFYRTFYINLLMVFLNGVVLSYAHFKFRWPLVLVGVLSWLVLISSTLLAFELIRPKILMGEVGPSIALNTDWSKVRSDVSSLKKQCGINASESKIVVDDMTYDALKQHTHPILITYLSLSAILLEGDSKKQLDAHKLVFQKVSPNAAIMQCHYFSLLGIQPTGQKSSLCCAKF